MNYVIFAWKDVNHLSLKVSNFADSLKSSGNLEEPALEKPFTTAGKRIWERPVVRALKIKRDTFSGSVTGIEGAGKAGPPRKK